jgi:hypothetical protein
VDLADPPDAERRASALRSLREAFEDNAFDRMAREIARYIRHGGDPLEPMRQAIHWSFDRLEFGWTHAYAGAADWLLLYRETDDPRLQLACLLEGVGHIAHDVLREPEYPYAQGQEAWQEAGFLAAIEREDGETALAMLRGGLAEGLGFDDFEPALSAGALAHYNDFGHALIYVCKAGQLIESLGNSVAEPLLCSLVRGLVFATREDLIPEFRAYGDALDSWPSAGGQVDSADMMAWRKKGIGSSLKQALEYSSLATQDHYRALLGANALNMVAFDLACQDRVEIPVSANVNWLDFTHGITFANAVRRQCTKFPQLWPRGLLQMALFNGRNASFTVPDADLSAWQVPDPEEYMRQAVEGLFEHGQGEFIVSVHLLKTTLAVREELDTGLPGEVAEALVAALNRFLKSPLKRRNPGRTAYQAMQFVGNE